MAIARTGDVSDVNLVNVHYVSLYVALLWKYSFAFDIRLTTDFKAKWSIEAIGLVINILESQSH